MRWPFGSPDAVEPAADEHRSPALGALVASLHPDRRCQVLDLGRPVGPNIEWLSARNCRVFVVDLHRSLLAETIEARKPENAARLFDKLLPLAKDDRFDAVLAWDQFNYLRPDQISSLMARLSPACRRGTLLLAFVATHREIPAVPMRYRILGPQMLAWQGAAARTRSSPCYHGPDLARLMPDFKVKSSFLLRNGIQEYLFSFGALAEEARATRRSAPE